MLIKIDALLMNMSYNPSSKFVECYNRYNGKVA